MLDSASKTNEVVIPGRGEAASPESITTGACGLPDSRQKEPGAPSSLFARMAQGPSAPWGYGFRAWPYGPSRNDEGESLTHQSRRFRFLCCQRREGLAFGGEALEQRRGFERGIVGLPGIIGETIGDVLQSHRIGPVHRAAAVDRPAVAVEPDHVDVARTRRDAFIKDAGALVDH